MLWPKHGIIYWSKVLKSDTNRTGWFVTTSVDLVHPIVTKKEFWGV